MTLKPRPLATTPTTLASKGTSLTTSTAKRGPGAPPPSDEERCKAKSKKRGDRCRRYAVPGTTVCATHGGNAKQVREAGARRVAARKIEQEVAAVLAYEGVTAVADPLDELGKLASASTSLMTALGARVNALQDLEHFGTAFAPALKAEVQMYERAMDRTHRLLDSLVRHGYTERQVTIAETEAALVAGVMRRVIAGLGLTAEQQTLAGQLLAQEFRALDAQQTRSAA